MSTGEVGTLAGSVVGGIHDGRGTLARFNYPMSVAFDSTGTVLFIADTDSNLLHRLQLLLCALSKVGEEASDVEEGLGLLHNDLLNNRLLLNRQGNDVGTQYRSGIYTSSPEQQAVAQGVIVRPRGSVGTVPVMSRFETK